MEKVSKYMRKGRTYSDIAVYLPTEDAWIAGEYPLEKQMKWSWGQYEMRYVHFPKELKGYHPLWINNDFLKKAVFKDRKMYIGDLEFSALYIDVEYLDFDALKTIYHIALSQKGFPIILKGNPVQAGLKKKKAFKEILSKLKSIPWLLDNLSEFKKNKLIGSNVDLEYWCRKDNDDLYIFISNLKARNLTYPLQYGQAFQTNTEVYPISIFHKGKTMAYALTFEPYQSILLKVNKNGIENIDIKFIPKTPRTEFKLN